METKPEPEVQVVLMIIGKEPEESQGPGNDDYPKLSKLTGNGEYFALPDAPSRRTLTL
jgi:hypothetical protein